MADLHTTRQFFDECDVICTALESMASWTGQESERIEAAQAPIISRFRDLLDQADSIIGGQRG